MNHQHNLLRDFYEVSTLRLEVLRLILIDARALGAKISGAGMGGSIISFSKTVDLAESIKKECIKREMRLHGSLNQKKA